MAAAGWLGTGPAGFVDGVSWVAKGLKLLFYFGPLVFAAGFLAPLTAQVIAAAGWTPPFGLSPLGCGFVVAAALGIPAQIRGRWI